MENFLLEQIYISGEFEKTLKQFISDARDEGNDDHKQEKSSESEEDGKSKNFEENSSVDEQKTKNSYLKKKTTKDLRNSEKSESFLKKKTVSGLEKKNSDLSDENLDDSMERGFAQEAINEIRQESKNFKETDDENYPNDEDNEMDSNDENSKRKELPNKKKMLKNSSKPKKKQGWFSNLIENHENTIKEIFIKTAGNKETLSVEKLPTLFELVTNQLNVEMHDHHLELFSKTIETLYPAKVVQKPKKKTKIVYTKINFSEFVELMNLFGKKYSKEQEKLQGQVFKTIKEYQELKYRYSEIPGIHSILESLEKYLEFYLSKHIDGYKEQTNIKDAFKKNLEDIFDFYGKTQRIQGTDDTFEAMEASNTN